MKQKLVIIGNGMAPGRMLEHIFAMAPDAFEVTIFNAEPRVNYNRLMLSPVLSGEKTYQDIITHGDDWYDARGITLHKNAKVTEIDREARIVRSVNGIEAAYDQLVIATGSTPFIIPLPGHDLDGVLTYRDLDDVECMLKVARDGGRAVVIGGGLLGLEAAAGLKKQGMEVTVLHLMPTLMERQLDPAAGHLLEQAFQARGIEIRTQANSREIIGKDGKVIGIRLEDGTEIDASIIVMAVGIRPSIALARQAGLDTNRGILVDDAMRTSDPDIFSLGECVEHRDQCYGLVAPLYEMGAVLADNLLGRHALYHGSVTATKLKVTGIDLYSAGDFAPADDREDIILRDGCKGVYKRLVLKDNRIVGAVLYGDTTDGPWFFELLKQGIDISPLRDTLIFGQAYQGEEFLPPAKQALVPERDASGRNGAPQSEIDEKTGTRMLKRVAFR